MFIINSCLNLDPFFKCNLLKYFVDKLETSHLIPGSWFFAHSMACFVLLLVHVVSFIVYFKLDGVINVVLHEFVTDEGGVITNPLLQRIIIFKNCIILLEQTSFCLSDDVLKFITHIKDTFKKVSQRQDLLVFSLFIVPYNSTPHILMMHHSFNCLANGHFIIEHYQFLIVR